ncbi:Cysteine-rich hydrophobic domain-containing protein [Sarcoptes scabiei]|nr:Cysteine-rich hydrophobic domain-containing protein [Sarcoptes scabiei]
MIINITSLLNRLDFNTRMFRIQVMPSSSLLTFDFRDHFDHRYRNANKEEKEEEEEKETSLISITNPSFDSISNELIDSKLFVNDNSENELQKFSIVSNSASKVINNPIISFNRNFYRFPHPNPLIDNDFNKLSSESRLSASIQSYGSQPNSSPNHPIGTLMKTPETNRFFVPNYSKFESNSGPLLSSSSKIVPSNSISPTKPLSPSNFFEKDLEASGSFAFPMVDTFSKLTDLFGSFMNKGSNGNRCKSKCNYGSRNHRMKSSVMPGLGDKQAEREVKKYIDENTLAMLLMKAVETSANNQQNYPNENGYRQESYPQGNGNYQMESDQNYRSPNSIDFNGFNNNQDQYRQMNYVQNGGYNFNGDVSANYEASQGSYGNQMNYNNNGGNGENFAHQDYGNNDNNVNNNWGNDNYADNHGVVDGDRYNNNNQFNGDYSNSNSNSNSNFNTDINNNDYNNGNGYHDERYQSDSIEIQVNNFGEGVNNQAAYNDRNPIDSNQNNLNEASLVSDTNYGKQKSNEFVNENFNHNSQNNYHKDSGIENLNGMNQGYSSENLESDYNQNPRSTLFEADFDPIEQKISDDESGESVGGIPLDTIKELVTEAMTAAEHHKKNQKSANIKSNQKLYGSGDSVVWNDQVSGSSKNTAIESKEPSTQHKNSIVNEYQQESSNDNPINHPIVKHVLDEIENNPKFLDKAKDPQSFRSTMTGLILKQTHQSTTSSTTISHPNDYVADFTTIAPEQLMRSSTTQTSSFDNNGDDREATKDAARQKLSHLLKKGYFGSISREAHNRQEIDRQ